MKRYKRVSGAIPTERQKEEESTLKKKLTPKSIIVAALALILAASMFGCSKDTTAAEDKTEKTVSTEKVETVQEKAEEPTAELLSTTNEHGTVETVDGSGLQQEETTTEETEDIEEETPEVVELFSSVNETVYATTTVNVRDTYSSSGNQLGSLSTSQSVTRTGIGTGEAAGWSRIEFNGQEAYVKSDYLSTIKVEVSTPTNTTNNNTNTSSVSSNSNTTTTTTAKPSTSKPSTPSQPSGGGSSTPTSKPSTPSQPSGGGSSTPTSKPSTPTSNPSSGGSSTTQTTPPPSTSTSSGVTDDNILGDFGSDLDAWLATQDIVPGSYENAQNSYVPTISQP